MFICLCLLITCPWLNVLYFFQAIFKTFHRVLSCTFSKNKKKIRKFSFSLNLSLLYLFVVSSFFNSSVLFNTHIYCFCFLSPNVLHGIYLSFLNYHNGQIFFLWWEEFCQEGVLPKSTYALFCVDMKRRSPARNG